MEAAAGRERPPRGPLARYAARMRRQARAIDLACGGNCLRRLAVMAGTAQCAWPELVEWIGERVVPRVPAVAFGADLPRDRQAFMRRTPAFALAAALGSHANLLQESVGVAGVARAADTWMRSRGARQVRQAPRGAHRPVAAEAVVST
jgi:hypothetical protein